MSEATATLLRQNVRRHVTWVCALLGVMALAAFLSIAFGAREVGLGDVLSALSGHLESIEAAAAASRIPRTLLAILAGAALGLSGGAMQGITRNPLADPGILGINAGSSLAIVTGIAVFGINDGYSYIGSSILGAAFAAALVYAIASLGRGGATPLKLALAGAATSAAMSALATAIVLPRNDISGLVRSWHMGGVGGATFAQIMPVLPFLLIGMLLVLFSARKLNLLALGDEMAAGLGEKVAHIRLVSALGALLLCGATTSVCGPIGFVGLVVPHFCRLLVGSDYRWLLPFSALSGAILLTLADVTGRLIARPTELDVGIVTAFIGAPVFIWIVRRQTGGVAMSIPSQPNASSTAPSPTSAPLWPQLGHHPAQKARTAIQNAPRSDDPSAHRRICPDTHARADLCCAR